MAYDATPDHLDDLDRMIGAGGDPSPDAEPELRPLAILAHALEKTAGAVEALDLNATWMRVAQGIRSRPRRQRRWGLPALALPSVRPVQALGSAAAGVVVLALSLALFTGGRAEADFLTSVDRLTAASTEALADDSLSHEESASLRERITEVKEALERQREQLPDLDPVLLTQALDRLTMVQQRLQPVAVQENGGVDVGVQALTAVTVKVQAVIADA